MSKQAAHLPPGPVIVDVAGTELTREEETRLRHPLVGGVILFTRNFENRAQLTELCASIHACRDEPLLISTDHEGGRVQRFRGDGFTELPAMRRLARHHRVLLASLREEVLDTLKQKPVQTWQDALGYCGTIDYLAQRSALHQRLAAHGLPLLDTRPQELGPRLVSQYLAWKKAGVF